MTRSISSAYIPLCFFVIGCLCLIFCWNDPIKDFGNYYYGSKLLLDGKFNSEIYTNIHYFNKQIALYGEKSFFENYIPVPPFSALFYLPFCFFKSWEAKLLFNVVSLIAFCVSLFRLLNFLNIRNTLMYLLPLVFIYPIYTNVSQGQTYLLISALIIEAFLSSEKGRVFYPSLLLAIVISLKLFPGFILFYFVIKKQYKMVLSTIGFSVALFAVIYLILPKDTSVFYITNNLPLLFNNYVVGTYYHGNQSVYTALLQLFSYDALSNPNPIFNNPLLVVLFESLFYSLVLTYIVFNRTLHSFALFALILFSAILLGRYSASYGMLFLLPLSLILFKTEIRPLLLVFVLSLLVITISLPIGAMSHLPFVFKFGRLVGLLLLFSLVISIFHLKMDVKLLSFIFIPMLMIKYFSFSVLPTTYFKIQNTKGILYDMVLKSDSLILKSTLGEKDIEETVKLSGNIEKPIGLSVRNNVLYYDDKIICETKDNKLNPFLYNDSVVFMSDLNQAVGFYKLRVIHLK
jgi:hypothetical protein